MLIEWVAAVLILGTDGAIERADIRAPSAQACLFEREKAYWAARAKADESGSGLLIGACRQDLPAGAESSLWWQRTR